MKRHELQRLLDQLMIHKRGGFPDLGTPHPKAGYRFTIGTATDNGKVSKWRENLGKDHLTAQYRARAMFITWIDHQRANGALEPDAPAVPIDRATGRRNAFELAESQMRRPWEIAATLNAAEYPESPGFQLIPQHASSGEPAAEPGAPTATAIEATDRPLRLHAAADRWLNHLLQREASGDVSDEFVHRYEAGTLKRLKELTLDLELAQIGKAELTTIRLAFQSKKTAQGKLRTRATVRTELGQVRTLFSWLEESELWPSPRKWERCLRPVFRVHHEDADVDPDDGKTVDDYTLDELTKLHAAAGPAMRLWLLCALNFAWGAKEIATARKSHFKLELLDRRRVARFRHKKTPNAEPVPGRWVAWPETWALATQRMSETTDDPATNPRKLAFLSVENQPLVRHQRAAASRSRRRYDVIAESFKAVCRAAGVRHRGFYLLRHTAINLIKRIGGAEVADLFCQHAPEGVTAQHYLNADWPGLKRAVRKLRRKLQPLFDAPPTVRRGRPVRSAPPGDVLEHS